MSDSFNPIWGIILIQPSQRHERRLRKLCTLFPQIAFESLNRILNANGFCFTIDRLPTAKETKE